MKPRAFLKTMMCFSSVEAGRDDHKLSAEKEKGIHYQ